jgi:lysozyme
VPAPRPNIFAILVQAILGLFKDNAAQEAAAPVVAPPASTTPTPTPVVAPPTTPADADKTEPTKDQVKKGTGSVAAITAAAVLVATGIATKWEGYVSKAAPDPVGIPTYCYGETSMLTYQPDHIYAKTECMTLLRKRMEADYAPHIRACMPEVVSWRRVKVYGAMIDASYNAGWAAVCKTYAPMVRADQWLAACKLLPTWYVTAKDRRTGVRTKLQGLVNRRTDEMKACLQGVA